MVRKKDRFWEYAEELNGRFKCKFCGKDFPGGIPRIKAHLSGVSGRDVAICTKVPGDIQAMALTVIAPSKKPKRGSHTLTSEEVNKNLAVSTTSLQVDSCKLIAHESCNKKDQNDILEKLLAKSFLLDNIPSSFVENQSFRDFVQGICEHGPNYQLPTCLSLQSKLIPDVVIEVEEYVNFVKRSRISTGCTLISDAWISADNRAFINVITHSLKGAMFERCVETSAEELTDVKIMEVLESAIEDIGVENIILSISSNLIKSNAIDDMFIKKYPSVCKMVCVSSEIKLLFGDMYEEIEWVHIILDDVRIIASFLYEHHNILFLMKCTNYKEFENPLSNGLEMMYKLLQCLLGSQTTLQQLLTSSEWKNWSPLESEKASKVAQIIQNKEFWSQGQELLQVLKPLFNVICLVSSDNLPCGYLYETISRAGEAIIQGFERNQEKYGHMMELFKNRRAKIIHPIQTAAAFLNPSYMCRDNFIANKELKDGIDYVLEKLVRTQEKSTFMDQFQCYRNKGSELFNCSARTMLTTSHPCEWWDYCGDYVPILKNYAVQILSQPCSSSLCKKYRTTSESTIQTKRSTGVVEKFHSNVHLRLNALMMEKFRKTGDLKAFDLDRLGDQSDYIELKQDKEDIAKRAITERLNCPSSEKASALWSLMLRAQDHNEKHLRLHFLTKMPQHMPALTKVVGEQGLAIQIVLLDQKTGNVVQTGPESKVALTIVVIEGDFVETDWTTDYFESHELGKDKERGELLLSGDLHVTLKEGMGTVGDLIFKIGSGIARSRKFRLGIKVASELAHGTKIREAKTGAFVVDDPKIMPASTSWTTLEISNHLNECCEGDLSHFEVNKNSPNPWLPSLTESFMLDQPPTYIQNRQHCIPFEQQWIMPLVEDQMSSDMNAAMSVTIDHMSTAALLAQNFQGSDGRFDLEQEHKLRKASLAWVKVKAVLRWGITVRNMAAKRRAQELACLGLIIPLLLRN